MTSGFTKPPCRRSEALAYPLDPCHVLSPFALGRGNMNPWRRRAQGGRREQTNDDRDRGARPRDLHNRDRRLLCRRWAQSSDPAAEALEHSGRGDGRAVTAVLTLIAYVELRIEIKFSLDARDLLLLYFFIGIGLNAKLDDLISGGRPLLVLLALT